MRSLAHVEKIKNLRPIEGADKIEVAEVLGWECVVKKGEFKIGDFVVYIEIDSIVPEIPEFEFLRERKFRVRTIKLRKQISQGLVVSTSILPNIVNYPYNIGEGDDVTELLKIKKYDPEGDKEQLEFDKAQARHKNKITLFLSKYPWYRKLFMSRKKRGGFPSFIKKTDEERMQNIPDILIKNKDKEYFVTEKLDGQSATYFIVKKKSWFGLKTEWEFGVCSRNLYLPKENNSTWWRVAKKFDIKKKMIRIGEISSYDIIVIQGEILGTGIQGNKYKTDLDFYIFNVTLGDIKFNPYIVDDFARVMGLNSVPLLKITFIGDAVSDMVDLAKGKSLINPEIQREGIVVRSDDMTVSFKVINPDFLLKYEE